MADKPKQTKIILLTGYLGAGEDDAAQPHPLQSTPACTPRSW